MNSLPNAPNISYAYPKGIVTVGGTDYSIEAAGADESYDAPDYQNMFMSYINQDGPPTVADTLPSFHRQDLLQFLLNAELGTNTTFQNLTDSQKIEALKNPAGPDGIHGTNDRPWDDGSIDTVKIERIMRKTVLRPLAMDHPNFTGSNENFNPLANGWLSSNERWDIDNDLDGVTDSVWVDMGFPVKTAKDGRRYKPLAAILIRDMDGLVNVNTAGTYAHLQQFSTNSLPALNAANTATWADSTLTHSRYSPAWTNAGGNLAAEAMPLPLGSGYGPADISLRTIFNAEDAYNVLWRRYSQDGSPGRPGQANIDDSLSRLSTIGIPGTYTNRLNNQLGTPTDRLGIGRTYFDYAGRPRFQPRIDNFQMTATNQWTTQGIPGGFSQVLDDPYEANLNSDTGYDAPYTYQELERIARYEEFDTSQVRDHEDRLHQYAKSSLGGSVRNRRLVTVSSFQVPTVGRVDIPRNLRNVGSGVNPLVHKMNNSQDTLYQPTLVTLCQKRLIDAGMTDPRRLNYAVRQLLPPEIMRGEPLDLNRLLESPPIQSTIPRFLRRTDMSTTSSSCKLCRDSPGIKSGQIRPM